MEQIRLFPTLLTLSAAGLVGLALSEGYSPVAYPDPVKGEKVPTVCFGETNGVKMSDAYSPQECLKRLNKTVNLYESEIKACIKKPLYQAEYDAYVNLAYNVGPDTFCNSTIVTRLNRGDYYGACAGILLFYRAGKEDCRTSKKCGGLWKRRQELLMQCLSNQTAEAPEAPASKPAKPESKPASAASTASTSSEDAQ